MTDDERSAAGGVSQSGAELLPTGRSDTEDRRESRTSKLPVALWALASIGLLAYVGLGSTPSYIWRFGRKQQEFKSVLGTWITERNNLPQVSKQWLVEGVFYGALVLFLLGAIAGLWFLLDTGDEGMPAPDPGPSPSPGPGIPTT